MAIIGTTESVLGRHEVLFLKAVIDGVTAFILTITIGFGVIFASISVLVYQGMIAGLCLVAYDYLIDLFINHLPFRLYHGNLYRLELFGEQ